MNSCSPEPHFRGSIFLTVAENTTLSTPFATIHLGDYRYIMLWQLAKEGSCGVYTDYD